MQRCDEAYVPDCIADLRGIDSVGAKFGDMKRCKVCEIKMHIIFCLWRRQCYGPACGKSHFFLCVLWHRVVSFRESLFVTYGWSLAK